MTGRRKLPLVNNIRSLLPETPSRPFAVLLLLVFMKQAGNGMVWSILAIYGQSLGASAAVVGLMISAYGGARLLVNIPSGYVSERLGRRAMMSAGCALIGASSFAAMALVRIDAFFVCLLIMGGASAVFMTSALAAVADLGQPGKRLRDMSLYQAANMVGASMGPAIGGVAAGMWGYSAPFLINGVVALVGMVAFALMPWPKQEEVKRAQAPQSGGLGRLARQGMGIGLMYFSIFYVRVASNWVLLPLIAQSKFNLELTTIGLILTCGAIANLTVLSTVGALVRIFGRIQVITLSSVLTLVACAMLAFGEHEAFLWITSILFGAAAGVASPTLNAYVAEVAPEGMRGPAMGLLRTMQDLSLILGPLVTGLLSDHTGLGYRGGLLGCLVLLSLATVMFRWGARGTR
ncbi:MAG: MFS transporter [Beijerinckiaceae bacterium]